MDYDDRSSRRDRSPDRHHSRSHRDSGARGRDRSASPGNRSRRDDDAVAAKKRDAIAAAAAAAERINALLQSKMGSASNPVSANSTSSASPLSAPSTSAVSSGSVRATAETMIDDGDFVRDIEINHLVNRYTLTKGQTQAMIKTETGADVTTRGRYYPDASMATEQEPLLYLHITAQSKEALEKAVTIIQDLMQRDNKPPTREASSEGTPSSAPAGGDDRGGGRFGGENRFGGGGGENRFGGDNRFGGERREYRPRQPWLEEKVPIGIDYFPGFNVRGHIVGQQGSNVKHIHAETGCRVQIKGRGSQFIEQATGRESEEPTYLHILGRDQESVDRAAGLARDLVKAVTEDYNAFRANPRSQQRRNDDGYNRRDGGQGRRDDRYGRDDARTGAQSPDRVAAEAAADAAASQNPDYTAYYAAVAAGQDPYAAYVDFLDLLEQMHRIPHRQGCKLTSNTMMKFSLNRLRVV
ncbi:uncharacterized protein V2V93DRAFT_163481 [Kockiozyma suomiensis]|uniref:uncharacterized protein n=1 Tax=Kockiozyma suomiensis TaxID=1337062 RepID=UPI003342F953